MSIDDPAGGVSLSEANIEAYLEKMAASGCAEDTLQHYRRYIYRFYHALPEGKRVLPGSLAQWRDGLLEAGYSARSVNVCAAPVNGLMLYLGHWELQANRLPEGQADQPELTRGEYLRLLSTARALEKERVYLLIKVLGTTGLPVGELERLTAEAVWEGEIPLPEGGLRLFDGLRGELLHFMQKEGITSGPVFLSKDGKPQGRTVVTAMIKALCRDARVPEEKANPRCLRRLYQTTQAGIQEDLSYLARQVYAGLLEQEQRAVGWDQPAADSIRVK